MDLSVLLQAAASLSAVASAIAAFLIYRSNKLSRLAMQEWSKTLVRPRIFLRSSSRIERAAITNRSGYGPGSLNREQVDMPGIFVENIGLGPAVKGIIYVIDHEKNRIPIRPSNRHYTFLRIPAGSVYHYPSVDSPELELYLRGQNRIRLQVSYFDIKDIEYSIPIAEEEIDLIIN